MYLGAYLGLKATVTTVTLVTGPGDAVPVDSPYTPTDQRYVDHIARAIDRLCEYSKSGEFEYDPAADQLGFDPPVGP